MAKTWDYNENKTKIIIDSPKQKLRITGHRIASVLGLNPYQTPFGAWAEITKLVKKPFEENKYILAGRAIEPKQIEYIATKFPNVMSIKDYYGNNFEKYEYNNFIDDSNIFGGIIDAVSTRNDLKTIAMICECKTSSKPQEWNNGAVPVEYLLQGALYSYLKGLDKVVFCCSLLEDADYNHPEMFEVNEKNTTIVIKKLDEMLFEIDGEYYNIEGVFQKATDWWNEHIETGMSPEFDEVKDKEYLDIIRCTDATKDTDLIEVCDKAYAINQQISELEESSGINSLEKELKTLEASIKSKMIESNLSKCGGYNLKKSVKKKFNEELFAEQEPKVYESYLEEVESYTLSKDKINSGTKEIKKEEE